MKLNKTFQNILPNIFGVVRGYVTIPPTALPVLKGSREHEAAKELASLGLVVFMPHKTFENLILVERAIVDHENDTRVNMLKDIAGATSVEITKDEDNDTFLACIYVDGVWYSHNFKENVSVEQALIEYLKNGDKWY